MKSSLLTVLLLTGLAASTAHAQSASRHFKPRALPAAPVAGPRPDVVLDGATAARLQPAGSPRPAAALPAAAGAQVQRAADSGLPFFISVPATASRARAVADARQASLNFLTGLKDQLQVQQPSQEFAVLSSTTDQLGQTHVRLGQQWQGVPVYGAEVLVHLDADGQPVLFTGRYLRTPAHLTSVVPTLPAVAAVAAAEGTLRTKTRFTVLSAEARQLLHYARPATELVVFQATADAAPALAWHVTTRPSLTERWETMFDATTGAVLQQVESSCSTDGPRTGTHLITKE